jgi:hypothetical protein
VELFHVTDETGVRGICTNGFAVSHVGDSKCCSWFSSNRSSGAETASKSSKYVVIVDLPDEVAERYQALHQDGTPYLDNFLIPWDVVNAHQPFRFEQF